MTPIRLRLLSSLAILLLALHFLQTQPATGQEPRGIDLIILHLNDTHGHEAGDIVLIKTAEVLKNCVRASDLVIRYGGEEFLILLIDIKSRDDIAELAERIRASMEATSFTIPDAVLKKTISIGYSEFPDDSEGFWEAIKYADVALYRAKSEGRNRVVSFAKETWDQKDY